MSSDFRRKINNCVSKRFNIIPKKAQSNITGSAQKPPCESGFVTMIYVHRFFLSANKAGSCGFFLLVNNTDFYLSCFKFGNLLIPSFDGISF